MGGNSIIAIRLISKLNNYLVRVYADTQAIDDGTYKVAVAISLNYKTIAGIVDTIVSEDSATGTVVIL